MTVVGSSLTLKSIMLQMGASDLYITEDYPHRPQSVVCAPKFLLDTKSNFAFFFWVNDRQKLNRWCNKPNVRFWPLLGGVYFSGEAKPLFTSLNWKIRASCWRLLVTAMATLSSIR